VGVTIQSVSLTDAIKRSALDAGFDLAGIAPLDVLGDLQFARAWVEKGYGGEMAYLKNPKRSDPRLLLPSAKSVVCVALVYNTPFPYSTEAGRGASSGDAAPPVDHNQNDAGARGWISRYAWGSDYHQVMRDRLERLRTAIERLAPDVETRVYVDTGPIVERAFARLSGIGWVGKNTCLINQEKGSWFFLGVILTTLDLDPDTPAFDRCGSCARCLDACPTEALTQPYVMDASRCIAYLNIELKGSIPERFRASMGANVFGCDICQDVCPWNRGGRPKMAAPRRSPANATVAEFKPLTIQAGQRDATSEGRTHPLPFSLFHPRLADLASLGEGDFRSAFAHSPIKRAKYRGWLRNLCVAMGNSGEVQFRPWLRVMTAHEDPVVREHAEWALRRLQTRDGGRDDEEAAADVRDEPGPTYT
jgi:epoxyqueuosine reductase